MVKVDLSLAGLTPYTGLINRNMHTIGINLWFIKTSVLNFAGKKNCVVFTSC